MYVKIITSKDVTALAENILNEILETEQEAARIEDDARKEARELVAKARQEAAAIIEEGRTKSEAVRAEILKKARQELDRDMKSREEAVEKEALQLAQIAGKRLDAAVKLILGRIVGSGGSR